MELKYKELQIIKHAMQFYVKRHGAIEKDIEAEKRLLNKITCEVDKLKESYGISYSGGR